MRRFLLWGNGLGLRQMLHAHELSVSYSACAAVDFLKVAATDLPLIEMQ